MIRKVSSNIANYSLLLFLAFSSLHASVAFGLDDPRILIVNSYHQGYKGTDDIVKSFTKTLLSRYPAAVIKTEYLDAKNFSGLDYDTEIERLLRFKYSRHHYDLIFASDDYAYNQVEALYKELFSGIPVVFAGTNNFNISRLEDRSNFHGVNELPSFERTIELIRRLLPDNSDRIVVVYDSGLTGSLNSATFKVQSSNTSKEIEYLYRQGPSLEELVKELNELPEITPVIYFAAFLTDEYGRRHSSNTALRYISKNTHQPIFGGWEFSLNNGIVGGHLINLYEHGRVAGKLAISVLERIIGEESSLTPSPNLYMIDYKELSRFEIAEDSLPDPYILINKPLSFYEKNRAEIYIVISFILLGIVFIAVNAVIRKERKLRYLATTDSLTGLFNRRCMLEKATDMRIQADRIGFPISVVILDLDHFKKVNDQYGHDVGDNVLVWFAQILLQRVRKSDVLARIGGEEFVIIMPGTPQAEAEQSIQRLIKFVAEEHPPINSSSLYKQTCSVGLAQWKAGDPFSEVLRIADKKLYEAKKSGRNCLKC